MNKHMKLTSSVFNDKGKIPRVYTCQGKNVNPPLEIENVPKEAKSLALIMEDPDVPSYLREDGMYNHWLVYNMEPSFTQIPENTKIATEGVNTSGKIGYIGPCPPDREHRYFFKLYALDTKLNLPEGVSKEELLQAMKGHIIDQCELMGKYEKSPS